LSFEDLVGAAVVLLVVGGLGWSISFTVKAESRDDAFEIACVKGGGLPARYKGSLVCFAEPTFLDISR
jgi:hypothetical protein